MRKRLDHIYINEIALKYCRKCKKWQSLLNFYHSKVAWDGLSSNCKVCDKNRMKAYNKSHHSERRKYRQGWEIRNRLKRNKQRCEWRKNNPGKSKARNKKNNQRVLMTLKGALSRRMSGGIRKSLKNGKNGHSWENLVGYNAGQLIKHLKKTMPKGYTWDNLDKLHIDHIVAVSAHNFEKVSDEDFKKCWALKNLQLLPAEENWLKRNKLEKHFQPSLIFGDTGG